MTYLRLIAVLSVLLLCLTGCKRTVISSFNIDKFDKVVVTADNNYSLTQSQVFELLQKSSLVTNGGTLTPSQVKEFIDSVVVDSMAGFRADEIDFSDNYREMRLFNKRYREYLFRRYLKEVIFDRVELDSAEVEEFYYNHPEIYSRPEQVLFHHILVSSFILKNNEDSLHYRSLTPEQLEEETSAYAWKLWNMLEEGKPFSDVAYNYSHDNSATTNMGFVGWTSRGVYKHPFDSIAFSLKMGEYSKPYKESGNWHIILVEDKKDEGIPPFDSTAYLEAYNRIFSTRADSLAVPLIDSLNGEINLIYNEPLLDSNVYLVDMQEWVAILNGMDTIDNADMRSLEEPFRRKYNVDNTTREIKKEMILRVANNLIMIQAARARKIDTLPEVIDIKKTITHNTAKSLVLNQSKDATWNPTDKEIEEYFNAHIDDYKVDKPLVVQQIIVEDSIFGVFLRDQAMAGIDFLELAQEHYPGEESVRKALADLGEIGPNDVEPQFYKAAMLTPVGSVTYPVKTQYGYQVIKVIAKYDKPSLVKARNDIVKILLKEHKEEVFNKFRDELYYSYNVRFPWKIMPVHLRPLKIRLEN